MRLGFRGVGGRLRAAGVSHRGYADYTLLGSLVYIAFGFRYSAYYCSLPLHAFTD